MSGKAAVAKAAQGKSMYARSSDAAHQIMGHSDWLVEHLTPRLREFIWARFQEAGLERGAMKLPKHDDRYITVLMKPLPRVGAEQPIAPVQYSVARVDIAEFENLARKQVQQARLQMEYLEKCRIGLENFRPVILVDTANIHGEQLLYVQAALKRLLYGFLAGKSLFNFVYFPKEARGLARPWATGMVPPAASSLREAEEFLETLEPAHRVNLLDGIKTALSLECDAIYLLSSGYDRRYDPNFLLQAVRSLNLREVSIFTIGIDVNTDQDEVFLRRLAESNHGDYKAKALVQQATASLGCSQGMRKPAVSHPRTTKMTIGGQAKIVDVIFEEHKRHEALWLEEQKCANRLLLASASQGAVPTPGDDRAVAQKLLKNRNRLGGGYVYLEENAKETPLREAYEGALRGRSDEPALWSGEGPSRHTGLARKSMPEDPSMWTARPGQQPMPPTTVTSLKVDTATLGVPVIKKPSLANPWERVDGGSLQVGAEQTRLAGAASAAQRASSARPGAPPRRSEENKERTERSIQNRRAEAAKHVPRPRAPLEHEVPEAWNLERRWSWG